MALRAVGRGEEGRTILEGLESRRGELTQHERVWLDSFRADFDGRREESLAALYSLRSQVPSDWTLLWLIANRELISTDRIRR